MFNKAAGLYSVTAGLFFVVVAELWLSAPCRREEGDFRRNQNQFILNSIYGVLLYSLGAVSTLFITEVGKRTIGRLRPHFLDVCKPDWPTITCFEKINGVNVAKFVFFFSLLFFSFPGHQYSKV